MVRGSSCWSAIASSASSSGWPLGVFTTAGSFSSSNSTACSCLGESRLNCARPARWPSARGQHARAQVVALPAQLGGVDPHAVGFDAASTGTSGISIWRYTFQRRLGSSCAAARGAGAG
jgi:hypothetical protein